MYHYLKKKKKKKRSSWVIHLRQVSLVRPVYLLPRIKSAFEVEVLRAPEIFESPQRSHLICIRDLTRSHPKERSGRGGFIRQSRRETHLSVPLFLYPFGLAPDRVAAYQADDCPVRNLYSRKFHRIVGRFSAPYVRQNGRTGSADLYKTIMRHCACNEQKP